MYIAHMCVHVRLSMRAPVIYSVEAYEDEMNVKYEGIDRIAH